MTSTIDLLEVNMSELAKTVQAGDTVIITNGGDKTPILKLEAIAPVDSSKSLGFLKHLDLNVPNHLFDPLPEEELELWYDGGPDDPLNWSEERIRTANAESNARWK